MAESEHVTNSNAQYDSNTSSGADTEIIDEESTSNPQCGFYQIRKSFEEKSKPSFRTVQAQQEVSIAHIKPISEFQTFYTSFKYCYTKRQFHALESAFNLADRNHDGFLEPKEVKQLLVDYQQPINLCDAEFIVSSGDKNQNGKLCPKEFLELCMPAAENLREEQFNKEGKGNSSLRDEEYVRAILQRVRNLVNPVNRIVKGTRRYFENIISGGATDENEDVFSKKKTVVNKYLETLSQK